MRSVKNKNKYVNAIKRPQDSGGRSPTHLPQPTGHGGETGRVGPAASPLQALGTSRPFDRVLMPAGPCPGEGQCTKGQESAEEPSNVV